eukprot:gene6129-12409_t
MTWKALQLVSVLMIGFIGTTICFFPLIFGNAVDRSNYENLDDIPLRQGLLSKDVHTSLVACIAVTVPIFIDFSIDSYWYFKRTTAGLLAMWTLLLSSIFPVLFLFAFALPSSLYLSVPAVMSTRSTLILCCGLSLLNIHGSHLWTIKSTLILSSIVCLLFSIDSFQPFLGHDFLLFSSWFKPCIGYSSKQPHCSDFRINYDKFNNEEFFDTISDLHGSCDAAVDILNDLLTFEQLDGDKIDLDMKYIPVISFFEDKIEALMLRKREKLIDFNLIFNDADVYQLKIAHIIGDEMRLSHVMRNILANAFKNSEVYGTVTLTDELIHLFQESINFKAGTMTSPSLPYDINGGGNNVTSSPLPMPLPLTPINGLISLPSNNVSRLSQLFNINQFHIPMMQLAATTAVTTTTMAVTAARTSTSLVHPMENFNYDNFSINESNTNNINSTNNSNTNTSSVLQYNRQTSKYSLPDYDQKRPPLQLPSSTSSAIRPSLENRRSISRPSIEKMRSGNVISFRSSKCVLRKIGCSHLLSTPSVSVPVSRGITPGASVRAFSQRSLSSMSNFSKDDCGGI